MRTIACLNLKGGVAKSTTVINLAAYLAKDGKKVLVVDADSQCNTTDFFMVNASYEYFRFGDYNRMYRTYGIGYCFNGYWGGEVSNGQKCKVLAWMPLPDVPKEG